VARDYPILQCTLYSLVFTGVGDNFDSSSIYTEEFWHSDTNKTG
jgi:hypothetical protein